MEWLNIFGMIFIVLIMIPNIIYAMKCRDGFANKWNNRLVEIAEQIGRFGCFGFMIFNIPGTWYGWRSDEIFTIYLIVNVILVSLYCLIWIICFKKETIFRALALSVIPSMVFLLSGILSRSILLSISAFIFAPAHIMISYKNARIVKMHRNDSITDPQKLVRMELEKKGFDMDKIKIPERVYLLADDIFDQMVSKTKEIATMKYPLGGELYVFHQNETVGFVKGNMCSPAIATQAEDLIAGGVRELIHVGYAGGLQLDMKPGDVVITDGAYNDTAVARLYGYDFDLIHSSSGLADQVEEEFKKSGMAYKRGLHWTTDAGYRETYGQILDYREKGALCVEMEGVGLFTIANYRKCFATGIYIISDLIATEWELGWDGKEIENRVEDITQWMIEQTLK